MVEEVKMEAAEGEVKELSAEETKKASKKPVSKYTRTAKGKKRTTRSVPRGRAYIKASLNNTIISVTDPNGNLIAWASAGGSGFRGPKKATPYAASIVANKIAEKLEPLGTKELFVIVKGIGNGRDSAIRALNGKGLSILGIKETTPVPHNGCRPSRARRV